MKLICPHCGSSIEFEQAVTELEHQEANDIAAKFGRSWRIIYEYSDCFRQSEYGGVKLTRRVRIFKDLSRLFDTCEFRYQGKTYRTNWPDILGAITEICNVGKWGFKNHNYLKVMLKKSAARVSAEGLTAKEEQARELARRTSGGERKANENESTVADYKARHGIKSLLDKIGKEG